MISYTGSALELYKEALRVVPALHASRLREAQEDGQLLVEAYMRTAIEHGLCRSTAWAILYSAAQVQVASLVEALAHATDREEADVTERMVAAAVEAVATGAL